MGQNVLNAVAGRQALDAIFGEVIHFFFLMNVDKVSCCLYKALQHWWAEGTLWFTSAPMAKLC